MPGRYRKFLPMACLWLLLCHALAPAQQTTEGFELPEIDLAPSRSAPGPGAEGWIPDTREIVAYFESDTDILADTRTESLENRLRQAALPLAERWTLHLDPQPPARLRVAIGSDDGDSEQRSITPPGGDWAWRVAEQCRSMIVDAGGAEVLLTRELDAETDAAQRLAPVLRQPGRALVCLRVELAADPAQQGFRLFTAHHNVDPEARLPEQGEPPPRLNYLPYEELSLALAYLIDSQMRAEGFQPAADPYRPAPLYMLRRSPQPAVCLLLRLDPALHRGQGPDAEAIVQKTATALYWGLRRYQDWLDRLIYP